MLILKTTTRKQLNRRNCHATTEYPNAECHIRIERQYTSKIYKYISVENKFFLYDVWKELKGRRISYVKIFLSSAEN